MTRAELEAEIVELRTILYGSTLDDQIHTLRCRLKISPNEARVLLLLNRCQRFIPKWKVDEEMPPKWGTQDRSTHTNNVAVYISRLKRRLGQDAIERQGDGWHMCGYRLTEAGRQAVAAALA